MKIIALIGAALLATTGTFATAPADAQPRHGYGYDRHDDRGWRGERRGWRDDRGWRGDRGRGFNRGPRARSRVVCRVQRGYYGPVRRCFRVNR
ncbi:hypothetical protein [Sphingomonas sp. CFBP 8760]|uniref:hypothetical protein n=1 Tax=Sphingomonas sp. CFBP 8760 TaxID=2775282 RepID=UPI00177E98FB|nr:hypothetical protein [Sphingomonas sp. CFBP 8760]MBD8548401.1 hypothetical protein [Sphingomonas sp. CFBP 8760]